MIISNPNSWTCFIASRVTGLPCPFRINNCSLVRNIPFEAYLEKKKTRTFWIRN
jgi:hypothetical protein